MCYAIPAKLIEIKDETTGVVDYFGEKRNILLDLSDVKVGDYVYAQGGIMVRKIPEEDALEILEAWKEIFFELKKTDEALSKVNEKDLPENVLGILQKINLRKTLVKNELVSLFKMKDKNQLKVLYEIANNVRQREHGNASCVHGIIEFSNYCQENCHYCGIRKDKRVERFRMSIEEIVETARVAVEEYDFKALVLQSGEDLWYDDDKLIEIVKKVRSLGVLVFLSLGERSKETYQKLYDAGARAVLLRFETTNEELFAKLRPGRTFEKRVELIKSLKDMGYVLATGFILGLPGETSEDIVKNILYTKYLAPDMYSFGPLIPTIDTPLAKADKVEIELVLKTIAISRLSDANSNILVTTALETLSKKAVKDGLMAGANSMMINVTPQKYRKLYNIYDNRAGIDQDLDQSVNNAVQTLFDLGRAPTDIGMNNPSELKNISKRENFINETKINEILKNCNDPDNKKIDAVIEKGMQLKGLSLEDVALLLQCEDNQQLEKIFTAAKNIKENIYGNRLVMFAPLYITNYCANNCLYCGFRCDNKELKRKRLSIEEIKEEVERMEDEGHKRLLLVAGEDSGTSNIEYLESVIKTIYSIKKGQGAIRRININVAPLSINEYQKLHEIGIGTYQLFQETYHFDTYKKMHPYGPKADYLKRLYAIDDAQEGGIDDVGIGVLFGLYDYKFELLALIMHAKHLEKQYGVGPHTVSVPRIRPALNAPLANEIPYPIPDKDFKKLVAIIRLALPYTGIILSTREKANFRDEVIELGVSQISAGSKTNPGAYKEKKEENRETEQFHLEDERSQREVIKDIIKKGHLPSFCTACYRTGRTGEDFMHLAKPGDIKNFCLPNSILTFKEYVIDYGDEELKQMADNLIKKELKDIPNETIRKNTENKLTELTKGTRDLYF